jgi:hypothetical protein
MTWIRLYLVVGFVCAVVSTNLLAFPSWMVPQFSNPFSYHNASTDEPARLRAELAAAAKDISALRTSFSFLKKNLFPCAASGQNLNVNSTLENAPAEVTFLPEMWPVFVINRPTAYAQRKWVESELANLGYLSYTRVNGVDVMSSQCVPAHCQEGLTLAHLAAWRRIAAWGDIDRSTTPKGFLIVEDDVVFHKNFVSLWPQYLAELGTAPLSVVYVGQLSHNMNGNNPSLSTLVEDLTDASAPWTTHAYIVSKESATFLARLVEFLMTRAGWSSRLQQYRFEDFLENAPWKLSAAEMKIDFFMIGAHQYFFRALPELGKQGGVSTQQEPWRAFRSTNSTPAILGSTHKWSRNADIEVGGSVGNIPGCEFGGKQFVTCENPLAHNSTCGIRSQRLPVLGTGLAFQNNCKVSPFMLRVWTGESLSLIVPTCNDLRTRIMQESNSDPSPFECLD